MVGHLSRSNLTLSIGPSTPYDVCVCAQFNKSPHGFPRSGPGTKFGQTDGRPEQHGHPRRRHNPPPLLRRAVYKIKAARPQQP